MPFFMETETARINRLIRAGAGAGLSELEFFAREIVAWEKSGERKEQITGDAYYSGDHDILARKRMVIGPDGKPMVVEHLPNARVIDNQYGLMVDQKTNYLVGKPFTFNCENKTYVQLLGKRFNAAFRRTLKYVCEDALNGGKGWLFVHYNKAGELCFRRFPAYQILPFWADDDHTVLDAAARLWFQEVWDGLAKKIVKRVELFKPDGIYRYVLEGSTLIPDVELGEYAAYITRTTGEKSEAFNWNKFPLICFKYNKKEIPLIRRVKSLQDGINLLLSDFENNMEENPHNTILILKDYDGENLGEFRANLATFGVVKVRENGGVDSLGVEVNADNYKAVLELFKKALIENARGYDAKDERMGNNPNQMNIQSMYSDIDLDANGMETEFQAAFEELLWFVNQDLITQGAGDFQQEEITVIFNRDILINESEAITNCQNSMGILSTETIVEQHPWTKDVQTELERLKKEKEEAMADYMGAFPNKPATGTSDKDNGDQGGN